MTTGIHIFSTAYKTLKLDRSPMDDGIAGIALYERSLRSTNNEHGNAVNTAKQCAQNLQSSHYSEASKTVDAVDGQFPGTIATTPTTTKIGANPPATTNAAQRLRCAYNVCRWVRFSRPAGKAVIRLPERSLQERQRGLAIDRGQPRRTASKTYSSSRLRRPPIAVSRATSVMLLNARDLF